MDFESKEVSAGSSTAFLAGGGEAARLIRNFDWASTAVGPMSSWPAALKVTLGIMLHSRHPMFLWWGPELTQFYNDAYTPSFGVGKHPAAMGQRGIDCWHEIWPIIWPQISDVMSRGKASWNEDHLVPIFRNARIEDVYWTYGYSPVVGDDGTVAGTLVICSETTGRVVADRRQQVARSLTEALAASTPQQESTTKSMRAFLDASIDVPAALFYHTAPGRSTPILVGGLGLDDEALPRADKTFRRATAWSLGLPKALAAGRPALLKDVLTLPGSRGPEPVTDVFVAPTRKADGESGTEFVVYGLNPRIPFDAGYREFLLQLTRSLALAGALATAPSPQAGVDADAQTNDGEAAPRRPRTSGQYRSEC